MSEVFFTSDLHLNHANIIEYSNRPFANVEEMNEGLVERWNDRVRPTDRVFLLGDVAMGGLSDDDLKAYLKRLNGEKHLILGNHDQKIARKQFSFSGPGLFESIDLMLNKKINGKRMTLCHYALRVWDHSHHGAWQLFGHSHGTLPDDPHALSMDVGVDPNNWYPVHFDEVAEHMARKDYRPVDHHGESDR